MTFFVSTNRNFCEHQNFRKISYPENFDIRLSNKKKIVEKALGDRKNEMLEAGKNGAR